jgi:hypothetical protein
MKKLLNIVFKIILAHLNTDEKRQNNKELASKSF